MSAPLPRDRLEIEVDDFGPIVHARVDLRPMTVFIGPSNTGKSYLAILIYALHRFFGDGFGDVPGYRNLQMESSRKERDVSPKMLDETVEVFQHLAQEISRVLGGDGDRKVGLTPEIAQLISAEFDTMGAAVGSEIQRCFGTDGVARLVRKGSSDRARILMRCGNSRSAAVQEHTVELSAREVEFQTTVPADVFVSNLGLNRSALDLAYRDFRMASSLHESNIFPYVYWNAIETLMNLIVNDLAGGFRAPAFYLPADRTGVVNAHSALVGAMLDSLPMTGLQLTARAPMLSGVLTDFLRQLIQIDALPTNQRAHYQDAGAHIEQAILRGEIRVQRSNLINYPQFSYRPDGWKEYLPLMHASSMVSDLAPVVLYLRHLVQSGNVLIIEEPESHLYPAMQVEFTRQLAKLVQQGYRVIITTHSEWILEELSNILRRSRLSSDDLATVSESDAALTEDQVGVWSFEPTRRPRGARVVEVRREPSGLYDTGFDDVAIALHNDWASLSNQIGETE